MAEYVVRDRRSTRRWIPIGTVRPAAEVGRLAQAPAALREHWLAGRDALGYCSLRGLRQPQLDQLSALVHGGGAVLTIARFGRGRFSAYRLLERSRS